jgi:site-specific DNA-methyltransferase (adenine-specific)
MLLDFFAGSGTFGESAIVHNRKCILVDKNKEAISVMKKRFSRVKSKETRKV